MRQRWLLVGLFIAACSTTKSEPGGAPEAAVTLQSACADVATCESECGTCPDDCPPAAAAACDEWGDMLLRGEEIDLVGAAAAFERACDGGQAVACAALGLQKQDGRGVARDVAEAKRLYDRACAEGEGIGCFNLALLIASGAGETPDLEAAKPWFDLAKQHYERSCEASDLQWCLNLGVLHESGFGVPRNPVKSAEIYKAACDAGHGDSCTNLALQMDRGDGIAADSSAALALLESNCGDDSPLSCGALAQMLARAQPPDSARILSLVNRACLDGVGHACAAQAGMYALGELVPVDFTRVSLLERRACDLGVSNACLVEAEVAFKAQDYATSAEFFEKACFIGDAQACGMVAGHYTLGKGVGRDQERADRLMRSSCVMGYPGACVEMLQAGQELPLKEPYLSSFLTTACAGGVDAACGLPPESPNP